MSRLAYTQRILEIVGNIRKQKEEITKVHHCGCAEWVTQPDMPKGQMCVVWPHRDLTPSEAELPGHTLTQNSPTRSTPATPDTVIHRPCLDV